MMIIDLDAHQGNGHERDFMNDGNHLFLSLNISVFHVNTGPRCVQIEAVITRSFFEMA